MDLGEETKKLVKSAENQSFWMSERIIFAASLVTFFVFAAALLFTEHTNVAVKFHSFLDYLFDTVSVGTLTGLFRGDSGTFTFSGQFVLLLDMVMNGLIASFISILLIIFVRLGIDRKQTLRQELEKMNLFSRNILFYIFLDTLLIWILGTVLFEMFGARNLWEAIFNSASHIFNDGVTSIPHNMIPFRENVPMLLSGAFLITIGGIGISIRSNFYRCVLQLFGLKKFSTMIPETLLAPKNFLVIILAVTFVLQLFGAGAFYAFEHNNFKVFPGLSDGYQFLNSYYMSVSARTAGFTTIADLSQLHDKSNYILMGLMSIGASSGSFAGGIFKLTAFIYIFIYLISRLRGEFEVTTSHRYIHFSQRTVNEANFRVIGFSIILFILTFVLFLVQPDISGFFIFFESISAVTNTGLSLGATGMLNGASMIIMIVLMTMGKLGFITTVISFFPKYQHLLERAHHEFDEFPVD
jgi:trk system potassium uptake protein TrkH